MDSYEDRTARLVPGYRDLHKMTSVLLAERAPSQAHTLVLGAGGGQELKALAAMQPHWRFTGVDPSAGMLELARAATAPFADRIQLHEGEIHTAPDGPFDAATCLLTLHFIERKERLRTLEAVHRRLRPGAPFVVAHHSFPNAGEAQDRWLARNAAYGVLSGTAAAQAEAGRIAIKERLPVLSPEEDVALLAQAGFVDVELFYCALTFKGWVARRPADTQVSFSATCTSRSPG